MKTSLVLTILLSINTPPGDGCRTETTFPFSVDLETMDGEIINSSIFTSEGEILIIDFWNIRCAPCIETFNSIRDNYHSWKLKTNAKIIAIAAQSRDERTLKLIKEKNWPFEVYFDPDYKLFNELSKHHEKGQITFVFPTMFVFGNDNKMIGKLEGAKQKLKDGAKYPTNDDTAKEDIFDIDINFYYEFLGGLKDKKKRE